MLGLSGGSKDLGSVLSPALFSVYVDDLLHRLRKSGLGCHVGGLFAGAVGYADDLLLLAPSRSGMERLLKICEVYAKENNCPAVKWLRWVDPQLHKLLQMTI